MTRLSRVAPIALSIIALCLPASAQRGSRQPEGRGNQPQSERSGRAPQSDPGQFSLDAPLPGDDLDYQIFYRRVPKSEFKALRKETFRNRRNIAFEFEDLDYPTGAENPRSRRFDMGPSNGPVRKGWTRITKGDGFSWEQGYGWTTGPAADEFYFADPSSQSFQKAMDYLAVKDQRKRAAFVKRERKQGIRGERVAPSMYAEFYEKYLDEVSRDAVLNPDELAFKVTLPNGQYTVTMIIGDLQLPRYGMDVYANGYLVASNIETTITQHRGWPEPWPSRITFPVNVDRNFIRLALRANDNLFEERAEVIVETPDYVRSLLPYVQGSGQVRLAPFFGKPMNTQGPSTQMALSGVVIAPCQEPPLSLVRQKLFPGRSLDDASAIAGVEKFNSGDYAGAEKEFALIPQSEPLLKAFAYLSLAGVLDTVLDEDRRLVKIAISALEKACEADSGDYLAADQLKTTRYYLEGLEMIANATALGLSSRSMATSLMGWAQPGDILYSKSLVYRGRCLQTFDPHRWGAWQRAEEEFIKLERIEPGNRYSGFYLRNDLTGWDVKDYQSDAQGAPKWAVLIREAYNRLLDQAEWWGLNRQLPDGRLGGGWGDDVEIGIVWQALMLVNPDTSPIAMETTRAIAEGVWWSGDIDRDAGFFDGLADVEHSSEWTADSQAIIMGIDYGNPTYFERNLKTGKLMRDLWMDKNDRGHLHFKSITLGNNRVGKSSGWALEAQIDHPLNGRAVSPAFWAWWYSPVDGLDRLFTEWAEAWLHDSLREENGKPANVIPGPISFPEGTLGGHEATTWRRGSPKTNAYENPTYTGYIQSLFSAMRKKTGDEVWLKPRAARLTSSGVSEDSFNKVADPLKETRIEDKYQNINKEANLEKILGIIRVTWPSVTSEIAATDRLAMPGMLQILRLLIGGIPNGGMDFIPATFERASSDVAFMNLSASPRGLKSILYGFRDQAEEVRMRIWNLQVMGTYEVRVGVDANDDDMIDETIETFDYKHLHRGDTVNFTIPPRKAIVVEIKQTAEGQAPPKRLVDLAMAPEDIKYEDGELSITIHNIGNKNCERFEVKAWAGKPNSGALLESFSFDGIEAPNDLEPRRLTKHISWTLPETATIENPATISVEIDPDNAYYEITERNNAVERSFPYEKKAYMEPRMWPTIAAELGGKRGDPFPEDTPSNQRR